ncbi:MAG TPA: PA14 domain-containing protein, partial [Polyangiaceae bacterium]
MSRFTQLCVTALLALGSFSCGNSSHPAGLALDAGAASKPAPEGNNCESPAEGCPCDTPGATADCGQVERRSGDYVSCSMGVFTCTDGQWGACVGDRVATMHVPSGIALQGLGMSALCTDNPCDPYCRIIVDDPNGLALPDGGALSSDGGLQLIPHQETSADGLCTSMTVTPTPQSLTVTGFGSAGLTGEYFNQVDENASQISASWAPVATRVDPDINFNWDTVGPQVGGIGGTSYSVRWTGQIDAPTTEAYTLCANTDDGVRVWLDGALVINAWYDHAATQICSMPLAWTMGSAHTLRMEYYQAQLVASAQLLWSTPTIPQQVVPSTAFVIPGASSTPIVTGSSKFNVQLSPPGCYPGTPQPAWTVDRLDLATIDNTGQVSLISAVAGPINVTAYLGPFTATGVLNVGVNILDTSNAPAGTVNSFQNAAAGTDNAQILYPYDQTVLPIGLRAPLIQWDNKGTVASAVKVSLNYPATGTPSFSWSEIVSESTPPQASVPRQIWKFYEETAKGQPAAFSLQRLIGTQLKQPITRGLTFSSAPVRGHIYYTQYQRNGGEGVADIMSADPGSENPALSAFGTSDRCPVCHTMSANGLVYAAADRSFSTTLGGISAVNANGSLSPIADFVPSPARNTYTAGSDDWRGFAWAPLTPDGKYALAANNVWGNTSQKVIGIDGTRQVSVPSTMQSGGSGIGLLAKYYPSTSYGGTAWKRIDPQVNFNFGSGSPSPAIPNDFSVKRSGQVQAYFSETYKFEIVTSDTVNLSVGAASSGAGTNTVTLSVPMTAGALVPIELDEVNGNGNSNVQLFWSSPSTPRALVPQTQLYLPAAEPPHGANVTYYLNNNFSGTAVNRLEPDIASNYLQHAPAPAIGVDNWTDRWDAQLEAPATGPIKLCVDSDDQIAVTVDGTQLNSITSTTGPIDGCSNENLNWTAGDRHTIHLEHHENTGNARLILSWQYNPGVSETISSAYIYPVGYTPP